MAKLMNLSLHLEVDYIKVCPELYKLMKTHVDCSYDEDNILYYSKYKIIEDGLVEDMQVIFTEDVKEIPVVY